MRIGVAATAPLGADVLERLAEHHEIAWLLTRPDAPQGRGRKLGPPPAKLIADELGIPVHQPEKPELPGDVERGEEALVEDEGCLSLQGVRVPVERATTIVLEGKDPNGEDVRYELDPYGSRIVQHELDHLDGVMIIDRTDDEHRKEALATLRPRAVLR